MKCEMEHEKEEKKEMGLGDQTETSLDNQTVRDENLLGSTYFLIQKYFLFIIIYFINQKFKIMKCYKSIINLYINLNLNSN